MGRYNRLDALRRRIDRIDRRIVSLLGRRFHAVVEVGKVKRSADLPVEDPRREGEILGRIERSGLSERATSYVREVYRAIFQSSRGVESGG